MKLIRHGVFETNSSSAHSLAYANKVLRDYEYKINPSECLKDSRFRLTEMPEEYRSYAYMPLYFDDYGWSGKCAKRKSWDDNTCVYSDLVYSHNNDYLGQAVIKACDKSKWLYAASTSDVNANDWIILCEVNKYATSKK